MAKKTVGRYEWLGVNHGGMGYFVRYCPHCQAKIYLTNEEFDQFRTVTDKYAYDLNSNTLSFWKKLRRILPMTKGNWEKREHIK